jgi:hypothetical protein
MREGDMGRGAVVAFICVMALGMGQVDAKERPIEQLPKDVWDLAFVWTEPIKHVAKESRRFDPVSGLWFGMLEGSIKSVERTTQLFMHEDVTPRGSAQPAEQPLLKYSF